jgi:hypothetical protein
MTRPLVSLVAIPSGDAGAAATLATMRALVRDALTDPWAVAEARRWIDADPTDDADAIVGKIHDFFTQRFLFAYDPAPMDRVSSPTLQLQELAAKGVVRGDCDDAAVLAAFFGSVYGIPYKLRAVGFQRTGPLSHVYAILRGTTEPVPLDVTANAKQVVPAARRSLDG